MDQSSNLIDVEGGIVKLNAVTWLSGIQRDHTQGFYYFRLRAGGQLYQSLQFLSEQEASKNWQFVSQRMQSS